MQAESYKHYYLSMPYVALPYKASSIVLAVYVFSVIVLARVPGLNKTSQLIGFGLAVVFVMEFLITRQRVLWLPREMLGFLLFIIWIGSGIWWARHLQSVFTLIMTLTQLFILSVIIINILMIRGSFMPMAVGLFTGLIVASVQAFRENPESIAGFYSRVASTQSDPNQYALSLGIGILTAWLIYTEVTNLFLKLGLVALALLFAYQIVFFTGSRTGMVSLFVMLTSYGYVKELTMKKFSLSKLILISVSMVIMYFIIGKIIELSPYSYRFENIQNSTHLQVRTQMVKSGFHWWLENPVIGYGAAGFSYLWRGSFSHNNYIEILVDYGIIGFILYYMILFRWIRTFIRPHSTVILKPSTQAWIIMAISVLLFWDLSLVNYYQKTYWMLFSIIVVLSNNLKRHRGQVGIFPRPIKAGRP